MMKRKIQKSFKMREFVQLLWKSSLRTKTLRATYKEKKNTFNTEKRTKIH